MRLIGWYQLEARNNTAAILYPAPVRVSLLRIFPTGAQPFAHSPDIAATTEPETFFVDVFFNAYSIQPSPDSADKRTVKNALVPTRIAYVGGQAEFVVDMGPEYATRLIIFHGDFQSLFVAVYGEHIVSKPEIDTYDTTRLPVPKHLPIPSNVDPANSSNPTLVAEQLLALIDDPRPSLTVATRLIFSLKPEKEDWDLPDFPYLYSELTFAEDDDLGNLVASASRPIQDSLSHEAITQFAIKMHDSIGSNPVDDAYYTAKLLCIAASQHTRFSAILLEHLDLSEVYNEESLDETNIYYLRDAASNFDIARYFWKDHMFIRGLENLQKSPKTEKSIQKALKKLLARIRGWQLFENALENPDGDFIGAIEFLKDITSTELSTGCWLECMMDNYDLITKLGVSPPPSLPAPLFQERRVKISHEQFLTFVKALLGVLSVLPVLAWADSVGSGLCRERVLAVLVLWQGIDGYREIVNHCLLLRQLVKRLEWNTGENPPMKGGMLAERLLLGLARDPQAILREDLVDTILELKDPFSYIETDDLLEMGKLARVARDGLPSAIEELAYTSVRPYSLRRLRVLRVSLAIVAEEALYEDGELRVVRKFWKERSQGIFPTLVSVLSDISEDLDRHFEIQVSSGMNQVLSDLLFRTANDILQLIVRFAGQYPIVNRDLRTLTRAIVDLYACSDLAMSLFSQHSSAHTAAQNIRHTCTDALLRLTTPDLHVDLIPDGLQIILRALLVSYTLKSLRDPVHHIVQLYNLIDKILPQHPSDFTTIWATEVFPKVLPDLRVFSLLLDPETRHLFLHRLVNLDEGEIGLGEWLLGEELKELSKALQIFSSSTLEENHGLVLNHQIFNSLHLCELLVSSPDTSEWALTSLSDNEDLSQYLDNCLLHLLQSNISLASLTELTRKIARHASQFGPDVRFNILLLVLRNAESDPSVIDALDFVPGILKSLPSTSISPERLRIQIGRLLSAYSDNASSLKIDNAEMLSQTLAWLASQGNVKLTTLPGISREALHYLFTTLASTLFRSSHTDVSTLEQKFNIDDEELFLPPMVELSDSITMPLESIEDLLSPKPFEPSTPKSGNKTPDILGVVISPPTAILRSPAATGLTKTYANNDFRQLRQVSSTRLNTSRLPSTHVDAFGQSESPELLASAHPDANLTTSPFQGFLPMI